MLLKFAFLFVWIIILSAELLYKIAESKLFLKKNIFAKLNLLSIFSSGFLIFLEMLTISLNIFRLLLASEDNSKIAFG